MRGLRPLRSAGWRRAARAWLLPAVAPVAPLSTGELDALAAQHQEISLTVRNILHVLAGVCLFCVIALGSPDANLVASPTITIPILNYPVSFTAFLVVGPVLIGGLTLYLHVFYASLLELGSRLKSAERSGPHPPPRVPRAAAVFNVDNWAGAALTWFLFYWAPPLVLALFAWRAVPLDTVGPTSFLLAAALTLVMLALQIHRCPPDWRRWALPTLAIVGLLTAGLFTATAVTGRVVVDRGLDLVKADLSNKDLRDLDLSGAKLQEAKLIGADLRRALLVGANLQGADLTGSKFDRTAIRAAKNWILATYDPAQWPELGLTQAIAQSGSTKNLRSVDLPLAGLTQIDLRDADLSEFDLRGVRFGRANLEGARLDDAQLQGADLTQVEGLSVPQLERARSWFLALLGANLGINGYDIDRVQSGNLSQLDLAGKNLRGAELAGFDLRQTNLARADLRDAVFHIPIETLRTGSPFDRAADSRLTSATRLQPGDSFLRANLQGANLEDAQFETSAVQQASNWMLAHYGANMVVELGLERDHRQRLERKDLGGLRTLFQGNFFDVDLSAWNLSEADLKGANLAMVKLAGASLRRSDLSGAHLAGVDLTGADLADANIARADLTGAVLSCEQLWRTANWQDSQRSPSLQCPAAASAPVVASVPPVPGPPSPPIPTPAQPVRASRSKTHLNLVALGQTGSGRTTLLSAITKVLARSDSTVKPLEVESIQGAPRQTGRGLQVAPNYVEFSTTGRHYAVADAADHRALMTLLVTGAIRATGGLLVVSVVDGVSAETREQLRMARLLGLSRVVVFLNKMDELKDARRAAAVEAELSALLASSGFGDATPIVRGSALGAAKLESRWAGPVNDLLAALDTHLPTPPREIDLPFLMPVEDVFSISGRGTVVTGRIERGRVRAGDLVDLLGLTSRTGVPVTGIESFRKLLLEGVSGDNVGLLLKSVTKDEIERGQVLAAPGSIAAAKAFRAEAYLLSAEEGGRQSPVFNGYRPQIYVRTTDITGTVELEGATSAQPGGIATMTVGLAREVALETGTRFAIREGGRTVGAGFVTQVLP